MEKLFTVAGTATQHGVTKARFANDLVARIKILNKNGCTDINLVELPKPMTKLQALQYLQEQGVTGDAGYAVANKPGGTSFNPLLIFGGVGLGKTHLGHAIGVEIKEQD